MKAFAALSADDKDWAERAEVAARTAVREREKEISEEALAELVSRVGPNARQLENEIEKLCVFVGDRKKIEFADVAAICTRNKTARAFALGDALGDRDLPRLLKRLDEELWETKFDPNKSEIGLLYGLIAKVRAMLLLKEMLREGWIKPEMDYNRFKAQLERVPADKLPADRRFNPLALNPYVLYKALPQVKKYTPERIGSRHGLAAALQPAAGVQRTGRSAGVAAGVGADCRAAGGRGLKFYREENVNTIGKIIRVGRQEFCLRENRGPREFHVQPRFQDPADRTRAKRLQPFHH